MATSPGFPALPEPLEAYAVRFDPLLHTPAQRRGFRAYVSGLLLPRERNKTLTALVGAEPVVEAQAAAVQRLQFFLSEAPWDSEAINAQRLALLAEEPRLAAHAGGVLVLDDTGDKKKGHATDNVARQYLGSVGKIDSAKRGRHQPVGRWSVLLAGTRPALHACAAAGWRQQRPTVPHQTRHCPGAGRACTGRGHCLSCDSG